MDDVMARDISTSLSSLVPDSIFRKWLTHHSSDLDVVKAFKSFRFRLHKSTGMSEPSTRHLSDLLAGAVEPHCKNNPVLLLSSGKDSVSLALAFSDCGVRLHCVSIVSDDEERDWISALCSRLGHDIEFVNSDRIKHWLTTNKFELDLDVGICFDQAIITFLSALNIVGLDRTVTLIDGMGNDVYFGHLPSKNQLLAHRLGGIFANWPLNNRQFGYYLRSPVQAHGMATALSYILNIKGEADFFHSKINLLQSLCGNSITEIIDFRAFVRGSLIDEFCYAEKTRVLARQLGCSVAFPWSESEELVEYVFNLPYSSRFNETQLINKVLLRDLLSERIDYSRPKRGVDLLNAISIAAIVDFSNTRSLPVAIVNKVVSNRVVPTFARKRALVELTILDSLLVGTGASVSDFIM